MKSIKKILATLMLCAMILLISGQVTSSFASMCEAVDIIDESSEETSGISEEPATSEPAPENDPQNALPDPGDHDISPKNT